MRKIVLNCLVLLLLLATLAMADVDVEIDVNSDGGDITIETNPNSGEGETTYILNGKDFDEEISNLNTKIGESGKSDGIEYYLQGIFNVFMTYNHGKQRWEITPIESLERFKLKFRVIFDYYFVPRTEVIQMINNKEAAINQLRLEIMAMQKLINGTELCQARMDLVKELNLTSTTCGDIVYYNHMEGDGLIGLRAIEGPSNNTLEE